MPRKFLLRRRPTCGLPFRFTPLLVSLLLMSPLAGCISAPPAPRETAPSKTLAERLDPIVGDGRASVSLRVIELPSRRELYAREIDRPMMPASNMKLVTSAAALDRLGADRAFATQLLLAGDDLYLIGEGDPGLGDPTIAEWSKRKPLDDFAPFAKALLDRGLTRIKGNLYFDDHVLDAQRLAPQWNKTFREYWYAAPVGGLNFNDNCIDVTVYPAEVGQPVRMEVVPPTAAAKFLNKCLTGNQDSAAIRRGTDPNEYVLSGLCSKPTTLPSKPVEDPGHFTADALKTYLASRGITVDGEIRRATGAPPLKPATLLATHTSTMRVLIKRLNKSSQNMFAEAFSKTCGREFALANGRGQVPGTWSDGQAAAKAFLTKCGIDATPFVAVDGSGLARENRVTARMLSDLLAVMDTHPHAAVFHESLPIAGTDGTLRRRLADVNGRVHAKTGSIGGVRALSGYATTDSGRRVAFSILANEIKGDEDVYVKTIDDMIRAILAD
jgi:D-alanyl-D-alanine carboxypeptidase/D-alanyl-D-alanine-endopeptidase (penicillin-binding protein 4)